MGTEGIKGHKGKKRGIERGVEVLLGAPVVVGGLGELERFEYASDTGLYFAKTIVQSALRMSVKKKRKDSTFG